MDCPELKALLDQVEDGVISRSLKAEIESHLETCRSCAAKLSNFMKIEQILTNTVYGQPAKDKYLSFLYHLTGQNFVWAPLDESKPATGSRITLRMMLKIFVGLMVAVGVGVSSLMILGRSGCIGTAPVAEDTTVTGQSELTGIQEAPPPAGVEGETLVQTAVADTQDTINQTASDPRSIYEKLNRPEETAVQQAPLPADPADSSRLRILRTELAALRGALSRTPRDQSLIRRTMDKYRQLMAEQKRLRRPPRVKDYYNLGYLHYMNQEYPQTAIVTEEGIRMVRIGPVEYLHYLKAMSHFRIAEQAAKPLLPDTSRDESARIAGAVLRAQLDAEGRRQAVTELRRAISEFNYMLDNPELMQTAGEWILKCSNTIEQLLESP